MASEAVVAVMSTDEADVLVGAVLNVAGLGVGAEASTVFPLPADESDVSRALPFWALILKA